MITMKVKRLPEKIKKIVKQYSKKQSCFISLCKTWDNFGYWWDEGSKHDYHYLDLNGKPALPNKVDGTENRKLGFGHYIQESYLEQGKMLLIGGYFCGKPSTPHLKFNPNDVEELGLKEILCLEIK